MRTLASALACRIAGTRLYGKPMQLLDIERGVSVLDHIIVLLKTVPAISAHVLGIAEGPGNDAFLEVAARHDIHTVRGSEKDVLQRLIQCAEAARATDVFRITTESPFPYFEMIEPVWNRHVSAGNDVTVIDGMPEGTHFEVYTLQALRRSHERGSARHRSELCSLYVREHREEFRVEIVPTVASVQRLDLRLTIDYPEDLIVCRAVYAQLREFAPRIPLERIIQFLDDTPNLRALVKPYTDSVRLY
jgi:spore coat polysaccharide biosynthesis protein SpsF